MTPEEKADSEERYLKGLEVVERGQRDAFYILFAAEILMIIVAVVFTP